MNTAVQWPLILTELEESAASQDSPAVFFQQLLQVLSHALEARAGACPKNSPAVKRRVHPAGGSEFAGEGVFQ